MLDEAADAPVRLVCAPGGYGKTELVAEWARTTDEATVWTIALTEDSAAFWRTFEQEMRATHPDVPPVAGVPVNDLRVASWLDTVLHSHGPLTVVVDRFDDLDADTAQILLARVAQDSRLRLVVTTRSPISNPLARPGLVVPVVNHNDLSFDASEAVELASLLGVDLDEAAVESLHRTTNGWPRATRLVLEKAARVGVHEWNDLYESIADVQHALVGDLSEREEFGYLLAAAVPETFVSAQANALRVAPADSGILDDAERRGLGWWSQNGGERSFTFQPLIRQRLLAQFGASRQRRAEAALAEWYLEHGHFHEAFTTAIGAQRWDLLREITNRDFNEVAAAISADPACLRAVPRSTLKSEPLIGLLAALADYIQGHTASAVSKLGAAIATVERDRLLRRGTTSPDHVWTQGIITIGLRLAGRYEMVPAALRRFRHLFESVSSTTPELDHTEDLFLTETAVTELYLGQTGAAYETLRRRPLRAPRTRSHHFYGDALEIQLLASQGYVDQAREALREFRAQALPLPFLESFYAIPLHLAEAQLFLEEHEPDRVADALAPTEKHWRSTENWPLLLLMHVDGVWHRDDALAALQTFAIRHREQRHRSGASAHLSGRLTAKKAELLLGAGRIGDAQKLLSSRRNSPTLAAARTRLLILQEQFSQALQTADDALIAAELAPREQLDLHLAAATATTKLSNQPSAARHRQHATALAMRTGLRAPFAMMSAEDRAALLDDPDTPPALISEIADLPVLFRWTSAHPRLTQKELVVLHDLNRGFTLAETAENNSVSVNTVKSQRRSLYKKLDAGSAEEVLEKARHFGLI
ncbi:LuxR C-terminal-related transcriptional regulator [Microbacterium nanhaiense]|nr:LuxR C-terminal-related transcriptional regulator [Microbacterium nanhaiense]